MTQLVTRAQGLSGAAADLLGGGRSRRPSPVRELGGELGESCDLDSAGTGERSFTRATAVSGNTARRGPMNRRSTRANEVVMQVEQRLASGGGYSASVRSSSGASQTRWAVPILIGLVRGGRAEL